MKQLILRLVAAIRSVLAKVPEPELVLKSPVHDVIEKYEPAYWSELSQLERYLSKKLKQRVTCTPQEDGMAVRVHTKSKDIAVISMSRMGTMRKTTFFAVHVEPEHQDLHIWFKLAFFGYRISFVRPVLSHK